MGHSQGSRRRIGVGFLALTVSAALLSVPGAAQAGSLPTVRHAMLRQAQIDQPEASADPSRQPVEGGPRTIQQRPRTPEAIVSSGLRRLTATGSLPATVRVVTWTEIKGRPRVRVQVVGRTAAVSTVRAAQVRTDVLAVDLDTRVTAEAGLPGAARTAAGTEIGTSGDPYRDRQWDLDTLAAESAWDLTAGCAGCGTTVAVVDSGVDGTHPDLAGQVLRGTDYVRAGGNGWADGDGHGTHVAGTIAALTGNGLGVAGLAPGAKILPIRALDDDGSGWESDVAAGILYAVEHSARIVNLSVGGSHGSDVLEQAVGYARQRGSVVVAAAGNEGDQGSPTSYPAAYPGVVAVASVGASGAVSAFSNRGSYVAVAAPGEGVWSTVPDGRYARFSGTSMAAPHVAAAAALLASAAPGWSGQQIADALLSTADDIGAAGVDPASGHGLLDITAALQLAGAAPGPSAPPAPPPTPVNAPTSPPVAPPNAPSAPAVARLRLSVPKQVRYGSAISIAVNATSATGSPVSVPVRITLGSTRATVRTATNGTGGVSIRATRSGTVAATVDGAGLKAAAKAAVRVVTDARLIRLGAGRVQVVVNPPLRQPVAVQHWRSGRWATVLRLSLSNGGNAWRSSAVRVTAGQPVRLVVGSVAGLTGTTVSLLST